MDSSARRPHLLRDCGVIVVVASVAALIANAVLPHGLVLTRDYFPATTIVSSPTPAGAPPSSSPTNTSPTTTGTRTKRGLPLAAHETVAALFRDPRYAPGLIIFIDARDDAHYVSGHIPGARQFDHYHPERYLADILAAAPLAERIVIYCNGGDCEDSELAALDLLSGGIEADKVAIYGGGIVEWKQRSMPIEIGARGSGRMAQP